MRSRTRWLTGLAALLALALAGCGGGAGSTAGTGERDPNATLRLTYAGVQTLDPAQNNGSAAMLSNTWPVYDRLLQISEDGRYLPMLATKWRFIDGGRALELTLRKGVEFSDGATFDAAAVKANIERYKKMPASSGPSAIIASVDVVDSQHVVLHLTEPSRGILGAIASAAPGIMISPEALDDKDLGTHPVGTGAWIIDSFRPGQEISYRLRPDKHNIWDPESGKVARVDIKVLDHDAAYAALQSGQLDIALDHRPGDVQNLISTGELNLHPMKKAMTTLAFYMKRDQKPFDDIRVRKAVNLAIDRDAIVKALIPATSSRVQPIPSVVNGFDSSLENAYPYDPARAKSLLKQAGYADGVDLGTVYVANYGPIPKVAEAVQANLKAVGIDFEPELYDIRQLVTQYSKSDKSAMIDFISYPSVEPGGDLSWELDNPLTMPSGIPAGVSRQIKRIDDPTASRSERAARARKVVKWAVGNAVYAPVYQGVSAWVVSAKVHRADEGFLEPVGGQDLRHAWISR